MLKYEFYKLGQMSWPSLLLFVVVVNLASTSNTLAAPAQSLNDMKLANNAAIWAMISRVPTHRVLPPLTRVPIAPPVYRLTAASGAALIVLSVLYLLHQYNHQMR